MKPIRLFSSDMVFLAEFDTYSSCHFGVSWENSGLFTFKINKNLAKANLIQKECKIMLDNNPNKVGIIDEVHTPVDENGKGGEQLTVNGHQLKYLLNRRLVIPLAGQESYFYTASAETVMKNLVYYQAGGGAIADRQFSKMKIFTDLGRGASYTIDEKYNNFVDVALKYVTLATGLGWTIYLDFADPVTPFVFEVLEGVDRTASVIFSLELDTIKSGNHIASQVNYKNLGIVGGAGEGLTRLIRTVGTAQDENRFETFIDAQNLTTNTDCDNYGAQILATMNTTEYVTVSPLNNSVLKYETHFNVGDLVTVSFNNRVLYPRIVAVNEIIEPNNYQLEITFDKEYPDYYKLNNDKIISLSKSLNYREK